MNIDPTYRDAFYGLGSVYLENGDYQRAIWNFDNALRLEPENPDAHYGRAEGNFGLERYEQAIE